MSVVWANLRGRMVGGEDIQTANGLDVRIS